MRISLLVSKRWFLATLLVIAGVAVLARLGIWQLDRLHSRREFNARVQAQIDRPALDLNNPTPDGDLTTMEYREVNVVGEYDSQSQIALRNQYWQNEWGVHLVTPLRIAGTDTVVLVDRGWIPGDDFESGNWSKFDEPGKVEVHGIIRASQNKGEIGSFTDSDPTPGGDPIKAWNFVDIQKIDQQMPYSLLPVYIQQAPDPSWISMPYRFQPTIELTEGSHLSYAIQWFLFAAMLGLGYPVYLFRQERRKQVGEVRREIPQSAPAIHPSKHA
jgi:surfeit locus 1 family protein